DNKSSYTLDCSPETAIYMNIDDNSTAIVSFILPLAEILHHISKDNSTSSPPPRPPASPRSHAGSALVGSSASLPPCSPTTGACRISPPHLHIAPPSQEMTRCGFRPAAAADDDDDAKRPYCCHPLPSSASAKRLPRPLPCGYGRGRPRPARDEMRSRRGSSARRPGPGARKRPRRRPRQPSRRWGTCPARCGWPCAARGSPTPTSRSGTGCRGSWGASGEQTAPSSSAGHSAAPRAAPHCLPAHAEAAAAARVGAAGCPRGDGGACPKLGQPCTCFEER
ncbi:unnamed protein product, partial [Musa banksii]